MKLDEAIKLISGIEGINKPNQQWADLGCGEGLFTRALANLLGKDSIIHAVDINLRSLSSFPDLENQVMIKKHKFDFINQEIQFNGLDGVFMANSFHFVKNKSTFISKLKIHLNASHSLLIVEYDTDVSNSWVPYPISFESLEKFFINEGYQSLKKLHSMPSLYNRADIYSALLRG